MGIKLKWLEDILNGLSSKAKKTIVAGIVALLIGGGSGGGWYATIVFAKNAEFQVHLAQHEVKDIRKDIRLVEGLMKEYRDDYGKDLKDATDRQKEIYKDWEEDLEDYREDLKEAKIKAKG
jgi:hypothetical protein